MKSKWMVIIIVGLLMTLSRTAWCLIRIAPGLCELQGRVMVREATPENDIEIYFAMNPGTNSETRFKLSGDVPDAIWNLNGRDAIVKIEIQKETFSGLGEAVFIDLVRELNPYEKTHTYQHRAEIMRSCIRTR